MPTLKNNVIRSTCIGGTVGALTGGTAGFFISGDRLCGFIPEYFDQALAQSAEQLKSRLVEATTAASDGVGSLFKNNVKMDATLDAIKYVANKIPAADKLAFFGSLISNTLSSAHPVLMGLSYNALSICKDVIKSGLVVTCLETMSQYKVIPYACLAGAFTGATVGALIGYFTPAGEIKCNNTPLQTQSMFKQVQDKEVSQDKSMLRRAYSF